MKTPAFTALGFCLAFCTAPGETDYLIGKQSVGRARIDMSYSELREAYKGFVFSDTPVYYFNIDGEEKDLAILENNKPLMFVWTNYNDQHVMGLYAISPKLHTRGGFYPGMSIAEIKKLYPACKMEFDGMSGNKEYITIPHEKIGLVFMSFQKSIGVYGDSMSTSVFVSDTFKVDHIEVY